MFASCDLCNIQIINYIFIVHMFLFCRTPNVTLPVLPPKKFFGNTDKNFVNDRKLALQVSV